VTGFGAFLEGGYAVEAGEGGVGIDAEIDEAAQLVDADGGELVDDGAQLSMEPMSALFST